jgi:putative protein-disulfide isomerase
MKQLIYFYDPLCGWCYGFSPVMKKIAESYGKDYEIKVVSGGMMLGDRVGSINDVAPFIKEAYKTVEQHTGVKFGDTFVKEVLMPGEAILSSEKPCRATTVCKILKPEEAMNFAHDLQRAFYFYGKDLQKDQTYHELAKSYGLDADLFVRMMNQTDVIQKTSEDYQYSNQLGVNGFPTVMYQDEKNLLVLSRGYSSFDEMKQRIDSIPHYISKKP